MCLGKISCVLAVLKQFIQRDCLAACGSQEGSAGCLLNKIEDAAPHASSLFYNHFIIENSAILIDERLSMGFWGFGVLGFWGVEDLWS